MADNSGLGGDQLVLATGGYDHTIKIWEAHSGVCIKTVQHAESVIKTKKHNLIPAK